MSDHSPRMLVVAFTHFPSPGGRATRLAQRVAAFSQAGYALEVLTPKPSDLPYVSKFAGARLLRVPMAPEASLAERYATFERAVKRQLSVNDYDLIHTFDPYTGPAVARMRGHARLAFEAGGGPALADEDEALSAELRTRERELFRSADLVLVPTEEVGNRARGLGAPRTRVHVVRPAAELDLFLPAPAPPEGGALEVLLCAERLSPAEVSLLCEALYLLPGSLELRVTVSAELSASDARRLGRDELLSARVSLSPPVLYEELPALHHRCEVGLLLGLAPVRGESPPPRLQALAEMMASGLALVVPELPALRELVGPKEALFVPPGDPARLAEALVLLAEDPPRRRLLGEKARLRAETTLDERHVQSRLLALYGSTQTPSVSVSPSAFLEPSLNLPPAPLEPSISSPDSASRTTQPVAMALLLGKLPPARRRLQKAREQLSDPEHTLLASSPAFGEDTDPGR